MWGNNNSQEKGGTPPQLEHFNSLDVPTLKAPRSPLLVDPLASESEGNLSSIQNLFFKYLQPLENFAHKIEKPLLAIILAYAMTVDYFGFLPTSYFTRRPDATEAFSMEKYTETNCETSTGNPNPDMGAGLLLNKGNYLAYQVIDDETLKFWGTIKGSDPITVTASQEHPVSFCGNIQSAKADVSKDKDVRFRKFATPQFDSLLAATYDAFPNSSRLSPSRIRAIASGLFAVQTINVDATCSKKKGKPYTCKIPGVLKGSDPYVLQLYDPNPDDKETLKEETIPLVLLGVRKPQLFGFDLPMGLNLKS
jgi:hypothetical protein